MAVTRFEGGWSLTAAGDTASVGGNINFRLYTVVIVKGTNGTVTLKDGKGNVMLLTSTLNDATHTQFTFGGIGVSGVEYDAVSAGTAVVYVYGTPSEYTG